MFTISFVSEDDFGTILFSDATSARRCFCQMIDSSKQEAFRDFADHGYYFDGESYYVKWGFEQVSNLDSGK